MLIPKLFIGLSTIFMATAGFAKTYEIQMLNRGAGGNMVFEPAYLAIAPGDTVTFVPSSKGHNVETIKGMVPAGAKKFKSKYNKEFSVTLAAEGLYGVKCTPHYSQGMVALIQVGSPTNLKEIKALKKRGKAKLRLESLIAQVQ